MMENNFHDLLSNALDKMEVRFNFAYSGSTNIKKWQYIKFLMAKIHVKHQDQFFLEPVKKFQINLVYEHKREIHKIVSKYLNEHILSNGLNGYIFTPIGKVTINEIIDEIINHSLVFDVETSISKFLKFCENPKFEYNEILLMENLNIESDIDIGYARLVPSNSNFDIIVDDCCRTLCNLFFIDRSFSIIKGAMTKTFYSGDEKRKKEKNQYLYCDLLCASISLNVNHPVFYSWRFLSVPSNNFLCFFSKKTQRVSGNVREVYSRGKKISIDKTTLKQINETYDALCKYNEKATSKKEGKESRIIGSIIDYVESQRDESDVLLIKAFQKLIPGYLNKEKVCSIFYEFLGQNERDETLMLKLHDIRGTDTHGDKLSVKTHEDREIFNECSKIYVRTIKEIISTGFLPKK